MDLIRRSIGIYKINLKIYIKYLEYGTKWSKIAKFLKGRSENMIKNRFYTKIKNF